MKVIIKFFKVKKRGLAAGAECEGQDEETGDGAEGKTHKEKSESSPGA